MALENEGGPEAGQGTAGSRHETLLGLIRLQQIDDDVLRIERRLAEGPKLLERRGEKFQRGAAKVQEAAERVKQAKAAVAELELELKSKEGDLEKAARQQLESKSNSEYKALGDHMERLKTACSGIEDRILEGLGVVEEAEEEKRELEEQLGELKQELDQFEVQWRTDEAEYRQELAAVTQRREAQAATLPKGSVMVYDRVLRARDGEAVVPVEGRVCGGCRMSLTPNDLTRLRGGGELVTCKSCERILYIPGIHGA